MSDTKVATEHEAANAAIALLREAATTLKNLGDGILEERQHSGELALEAERYQRELVNARDAEAVVTKWSDLLADFRRGIVDKDELLERTVGRA